MLIMMHDPLLVFDMVGLAFHFFDFRELNSSVSASGEASLMLKSSATVHGKGFSMLDASTLTQSLVVFEYRPNSLVLLRCPVLTKRFHPP